jgi:precorrin-6Y C5,15-methyltransferase (decarboxylating)
VAIEAAQLAHRGTVYAIEPEPADISLIQANAEAFGVPNVRPVAGRAPDVLATLPEPDAVFVGGTGGRFEEIVKLCAVRARRSVVLALVGLERVVPAARILEDCGLEVETTFLQTSRMKGVGGLHRLAAESNAFIVSGERA